MKHRKRVAAILYLYNIIVHRESFCDVTTVEEEHWNVRQNVLPTGKRFITIIRQRDRQAIVSIAEIFFCFFFLFFFPQAARQTDNLLERTNKLSWTAKRISLARTIRYSKGCNKGAGRENETEYVFMGMYLLVRHYRIVWRKTFVINKWYTCIRDHGRYIPCHMSSALPALARLLRSWKLSTSAMPVVWQSRQFTHEHAGEACATCLA